MPMESLNDRVKYFLKLGLLENKNNQTVVNKLNIYLANTMQNGERNLMMIVALTTIVFLRI